MALSTTLQRWVSGLFASRAAPPPALFTPQAIGYLVDLVWSLDEPDEILKKAGKTRAELRKVAADDEVAAACETRLSALLATPWRLEPGDGAVVDFVWTELEQHATKIIESSWIALLYGYAVTEIVWQKRADGRIVPLAIEERPFDWFTPGRDGVLRMHIDGGAWMADQSGIGTPVDTQDKFILTRNKPTWRNPRGEAILSRCYWPWFLRSAGWRMWARFLERSASPILLGKSNDPSGMANALAAAVQSAVAAVGPDDDVQSIGAGQRGEAYAQFSDAVNARIQKSILGQTLTTEVTGSGSYAAAKVHDLVRQDRRMADIRLVTPAMQQVVNSLVRWNFPGAEVPKVVMEDSTGLELERAERDAKLAATGQIEFTEDYWLNRYDFEPGEVRARSPGAQQPDAIGGQAGPPVQASAGQFARTMPTAADRQAAIDALADKTIAKAGSPIDPAVLMAAVRDATDPEDLVQRLGRAAADMPAVEFAELTERALFAADVLGYMHDYEHGARKP